MNGENNSPQKRRKTRKTSQQRPVDFLAQDVSSWWGKTFVFIKKTRVKTWKGVFVLAFSAGAAVAIIWTVSMNIQTSSKAASASLTLFTADTEVLENDLVNMEVVLDTQGNDVVAAKAVVNYNAQNFELQSWSTAGSVFASGNTCVYNGKPCEIVDNDPANGKITITVAKPSPGVNTNSGIVAELVFRALQPVSPSTANFTLSYSPGSYTDSDVIHDDGQGTDSLTGVTNATVAVIVPDTTAPVLAEVSPVATPTSDSTPSYVFSSSEAGTISYGGSCSSATTSALSGNNTVNFNVLPNGTYGNCTITVTDAADNESNVLQVNTFTIDTTIPDTTAPVLSQVTPVPNPTSDNTPNYTFHSSENGSIEYGGDCSSSNTSASEGNNTITFNALNDGNYSNCTITVTDASENSNNPLQVNTFTVDTTVPDTVAPVRSNGSPTGSLPSGTASVNISLRTNEESVCRFSSSSGNSFDAMGASSAMSASSGGTNHSASVSGLEDGQSYGYYVRCRDMRNNSNNNDYPISFSVAAEDDNAEEIGDSGEVDVDSTKIKIGDDKSEKLEKDKTFYSKEEKFSFKGSVSGGNNIKARLIRDGKEKEEENVDSDGDWKISVKEKDDGNHTYKIEFIDGDGKKVGETRKYKVKVDTEGPEFLDLPLALNKNRGDKIWWTATDHNKTKNNGIAYYKYKFVGGGDYTKTKNNFFNVPTSMSRGIHVLFVRAYDKAGNDELRVVTVRIK